MAGYKGTALKFLFYYRYDEKTMQLMYAQQIFNCPIVKKEWYCLMLGTGAINEPMLALSNNNL